MAQSIRLTRSEMSIPNSRSEAIQSPRGYSNQQSRRKSLKITCDLGQLRHNLRAGTSPSQSLMHSNWFNQKTELLWQWMGTFVATWHHTAGEPYRLITKSSLMAQSSFGCKVSQFRPIKFISNHRQRSRPKFYLIWSFWRRDVHEYRWDFIKPCLFETDLTGGWDVICIIEGDPRWF